MTHSSAPPRRAADLLLVRLLPPGKSRPGPKRVRDDLHKLGVPLAADEAWAGLLADVRSAGLVAAGGPLSLTDAGRARALAVLGLANLPPGATWPRLRDRHLVAAAARAARATDGEADLSTKGKLASFLLNRKYGLRTPAGATLAAAVAALVCKELGFPDLTDLRALPAAVLSRVLGAEQLLPIGSATEQLVRVKLNAPRGTVEELRQSLIAEWVRGDATGSRPPEDRVTGASRQPQPAGDLRDFAAAVARAARASATGRFGDDKVFISHVWRALQNDGRGAGVGAPDFAAFKRRLVEANRAGLLELSRADLVAAMDPADVRESEARYLNAEFHFVRTAGRVP